MAKHPGFSEQSLNFFKALAFHQDREWFQENKALYETEVKEPMLALLAELTERFDKAGIPLRGDKRGMFRINRDIRFSKDKRPYQTHTGAVMTRSGGKDDPGLLYIHITGEGMEHWREAPEGSFMVVGFHQPDSAGLNAFRTTIKRKPDDFLALEAKLKKAKLAFSTGNQLTRVPRGFEDMKGSDVEGAIRLKSFMVEEQIPTSIVTSPKLADTLVKFTERALPLLEWGWKSLG